MLSPANGGTVSQAQERRSGGAHGVDELPRGTAGHPAAPASEQQRRFFQPLAVKSPLSGKLADDAQVAALVSSRKGDHESETVSEGQLLILGVPGVDVCTQRIRPVAEALAYQGTAVAGSQDHHVGRQRLKDRKSTRLNSSHVAISYA